MSSKSEKILTIPGKANSLSLKEMIKPLSLQCLQLALISLAIHLFNIEEHLGLPQLMLFVFAAFVINAVLPKTNRLAFFFFASLTPIIYFFGWLDGSLLIGCALLMIGTCHLPIALRFRKIGVLLLGALLAGIKYAQAQGMALTGLKLSSQMVTVLGIMFMFRMILYLYELNYEKEKVSIWQRLSYFFMIPNICFPIFPIVDYKTFKRTYYDKQDILIYQKGLNLIVLGLVQLLFYRLLYYLTPGPAEVNGFWVLIRYLVLSYLMLIRLNGLLNIVVGLLRLFGFNLPDIFNYMFLARGFDDYWRRLNIYWKDFLVKIIYYPLYFKFRKKGKVLAIVIGTLVTFVFNWAFHAYQWFWILGDFPLRPTEMLTWAILGLFVLVSILRQQKKEQKRSTLISTGLASAFRKMGLVMLTFGVMTLIYSLLINPTLGVWWKMLGQARAGTIIDWVLLLLGISIILALGACLFHLAENGRFSMLSHIFRKDESLGFLNVGVLAVMLFLSAPIVDKMAIKWSGYSTYPFINHHLNLHDQRKQFDGYYEELMFADNFSSPLWQLEHNKPSDWENISELGIIRNENGITSLEPNAETVFKNARLSTNRWGHRDRNYEKRRPENTTRLAVVGGSAEMGAGVENEEVFEQLAENQLNATFGSDSNSIEIINFAVSGMSVIRNIEKIRSEVFEFQPQHLMIFAHKLEHRHVLKSARWLQSRYGTSAIPDSLRAQLPWLLELNSLLKKEDIDALENMTNEEVVRLGWKVLDWGYQYIARMCAERDVQMVMVFLPDVYKSEDNPDLPFQQIAAKYDITFFNLKDIFDDYPMEELQIAVWDNHPNAFGHQLIADQLYLELANYLNLE